LKKEEETREMARNVSVQEVEAGKRGKGKTFWGGVTAPRTGQGISELSAVVAESWWLTMGKERGGKT